jgi:hypothetical protein
VSTLKEKKKSSRARNENKSKNRYAVAMLQAKQQQRTAAQENMRGVLKSLVKKTKTAAKSFFKRPQARG